MNQELINDLLSRLSQSEGPWVEKKRSFHDQEVRKTIVAFANSLGDGQTAVLFIGADNSGDHSGVSDADDVQKKVAGVLERCYPPITYHQCVLPMCAKGRDIEIVAIVVSFSINRPHFAGVAYMRRGSESMEASQEVFRELIASQNDKARRILQCKGTQVTLRFRSDSGFWYGVDGVVEFCDAHSATIRDIEGSSWSFPIEKIEIHKDGMQKIIFTVKPDWTEEQHLRRIVNRWTLSQTLSNRPLALDRQNVLIAQLFANPLKAVEAAASEADGASSPWPRLLLVHLQFELKKLQAPRTKTQKLQYLTQAQRQTMEKIAKSGIAIKEGSVSQNFFYSAQVSAVLDVATALDEAVDFIEHLNSVPPIRERQMKLLFETLDLPSLLRRQ